MLQEHGYDVLTVMDYKSAEPRGDLMIDYAGLTKDDEGKVFWHVAKPDVVKSYLQHILRVRTQGGGRLDQLRTGGGRWSRNPTGRNWSPWCTRTSTPWAARRMTRKRVIPRCCTSRCMSTATR